MTAELEDVKALWLGLRARIDELAAERQQYLEIFEDSPEAYVVTDREGTVVGLTASGSEAARTMAALVQHALNTSPTDHHVPAHRL